MNKCIGLTYRGRVNNFISRNGEYVRTERLVKLKKKSCTGCEICEVMLDSVAETFYDTEGLCMQDSIENGKLYSPVWVDLGPESWETPHIRDAEVQWRLVKEKNNVKT